MKATQYNGIEGSIVGYNQAQDRYVFEITEQLGQETSTKKFSVRRENCVLPRGARARVAGLSKSPQFNGMWGQIRDFDPATQRYSVRIQKDKVVRLKLGNL